MRRRLVLAAAATAVVALPAAASGAPARPQIRDMKGDARGGLAYVDILAGRWSTSGTGAGKSLVVTMTLAAPVKTETGYVYEMQSQVRGCGAMWFSYSPGTVAEAANQLQQPLISDGTGAGRLYLSCGGSQNVNKSLRTSVKDNVITWSIAFEDLPEQVQPGAMTSDFFAFADLGDPVVGESSATVTEQALDTATGDGAWKIR